MTVSLLQRISDIGDSFSDLVMNFLTAPEEAESHEETTWTNAAGQTLRGTKADMHTLEKIVQPHIDSLFSYEQDDTPLQQLISTSQSLAAEFSPIARRVEVEKDIPTGGNNTYRFSYRLAPATPRTML